MPTAYDDDSLPTPAHNGRDRLRTLPSLDGRTRAARLAARLVGELENDLGGGELTAELTAGQRELVKRVAMLSAITEDIETRWLEHQTVDLVAYGTLTDRLRRLLESLGLNTGGKIAPPRDVTDQIIEQFRNGTL